MQLRAGSLRRTTELTNLQPNSLRKKERAQINKIKNEITTNSTEVQRIIKDYYEQLYTSKFNNVEEMDKFLEVYNLPRLNQEEFENLNRPVTTKGIEVVIKNLPANKKSRSTWLHSLQIL